MPWRPEGSFIGRLRICRLLRCLSIVVSSAVNAAMNAGAPAPRLPTPSPSPDAMARRISELEHMVVSLHEVRCRSACRLMRQRFDRLRTYIWERHEALEVRCL